MYKSTALKFGKSSKKWVSGFYAASLVLLTLAFLMSAGGVLWPVFVLVLAGHFMWQIKNWQPDNPESSLRVFKSNRDFGLIVLAACCLI